jgi:hypothetical protein
VERLWIEVLTDFLATDGFLIQLTFRNRYPADKKTRAEEQTKRAFLI